MSDLKMALIKKYGVKAKDGGYSVDTAALNKINRILHAYHVRFGYSKGKRPKISKTKLIKPRFIRGVLNGTKKNV